jgi:hypothetical protein
MPGYQIINVPHGVSLAVVGDIHEHTEQFFKLIDTVGISNNLWLVSVGDIYDKGFGLKHAEKITDEMISLYDDGICHAVRGNHELKIIKNTFGKLGSSLKWWKERPLAITFNFFNGSKCLVLHAGITPYQDESELGSSVDICYVRDLDEDGKMIPLIWEYDTKTNEKYLKKGKEGKPWHESYDGRMGYILSGHDAQKDGKAKFYAHSCNLDSAVYETGILTCQIVSDAGRLGDTITVDGVPSKPKLNIR